MTAYIMTTDKMIADKISDSWVGDQRTLNKSWLF